MSKLFSEDCSKEFQEKVFDKIDEALENGSSTLNEGDEVYQFAELDGDVVIEDQTDGANEVTRASIDENDPTNYALSEVEIPAEEPTAEPTEEPTAETKVESEEEPTEEPTVAPEVEKESITIERPASMSVDGEDDEIVDEDVIDVQSEEDGNAEFSLKFKNFSKKRIDKYVKIFSKVVKTADEVVASANINTDIKVKFENGEMKFFSEHDADVTEVINAANELAGMTKDGITKENAEEIKSKAEEVIEMAEKIEGDEVKLECVKAMCSMYSEKAAEVADQDEPTAEPSEEPTAEPSEEPTAEPTAEPTEEPTEETKVESRNQVMQCPETGKWYIEGDPDEQKFDTQEEAEQVRAKSFSDPQVKVEISGLEPASVADLLGIKKDEPKDENPEAPEAPKIDPNEGATHRQFSLSAQKSINPYLTTEIN